MAPYVDPDWAWTRFEPTDTDPWNVHKITHLYRRAGFGISSTELEDALQAGMDATIDRLVYQSAESELFQRDMQAMTRSLVATSDPDNLSSGWLYRMLNTTDQLREKITLFWHGHFATGADKVTDAFMMQQQNTMLRQLALGNFNDLAQGISKDPAMLLYLDSATNRKTHPNENFARELMELFCLGEGNYSEADIRELHAANVELIALDDAEIKYSTVQNWYPGDKDGKGGIYNFVTKRGLCKGKNSKISWTQVETGSAITWKYPSCILRGDNSIGEFYSIAITNNHQKADTGTKMIHIGKNTKSKIISKGISAGKSDMTYRGLVDISQKAINSSNYTQCDSLLMGNKCGAHTVPYIKNKNSDSTIAHEATTSKISEEQLHYCQQRGLNPEEAVGLIVNGFCKEVLQQLPMEFAVEAQKLVGISLEGSVG